MGRRRCLNAGPDVPRVEMVDPETALGYAGGMTAEDLDRAVREHRVFTVTQSDGSVGYPKAQFRMKPKSPLLVRAAYDAFADLDPSGLLAAHWLIYRVSPWGFVWRDLDVLVEQDGAFPLISAMARADAERAGTGA